MILRSLLIVATLQAPFVYTHLCRPLLCIHNYVGLFCTCVYTQDYYTHCIHTVYKELFCADTGIDTQIHTMRWLRLVGSLKFQVSFAKEPYKRDDILQKRPIILKSLLIVATLFVYVKSDPKKRGFRLFGCQRELKKSFEIDTRILLIYKHTLY